MRQINSPPILYRLGIDATNTVHVYFSLEEAWSAVADAEPATKYDIFSGPTASAGSTETITPAQMLAIAAKYSVIQL